MLVYRTVILGHQAAIGMSITNFTTLQHQNMAAVKPQALGTFNGNVNSFSPVGAPTWSQVVLR